MLLFQDVPIINKHLRPFSTLRCLQQAKIFSLQFCGNVGFTVWHLGIPNYILVSSLCFPHLCPVVLHHCAFLAIHPLCFIQHFVTCLYVLAVSKHLHSILLQLPFGQIYFAAVFFVFTCSSYTSLQISVMSVISVFENNLFLCFL